VRRLADAFNRGDFEGVVAQFDPDCRLEEPPQMPDRPAGGYRGHDGIREWMANLRRTAEIRFEPRSFEVAGDAIVSEWRATGVGRASGAPMDWVSHVMLRLREGRIVEARAFLSRDEAREAARVAG